ncbi:MAG: DUF1127 domain-containing protein [Geminicoccaceae bacterium]
MRQTFPDTGTAMLWSAVAAATVPLPGRGFGAAPREHLVSRRAASWPGQVRATLRLWQDRVSGRQQLLRLDDRVLRDIGITRLQAEAAASKPFWRA